MLRKSNCARPWDAAIEGRAWPREVLKTKVIEATVKENLMLGRSLDSINALLTPDQRRAFHKQNIGTKKRPNGLLKAQALGLHCG